MNFAMELHKPSSMLMKLIPNPNNRLLLVTVMILHPSYMATQMVIVNKV